jgi:hypothetical protein
MSSDRLHHVTASQTAGSQAGVLRVHLSVALVLAVLVVLLGAGCGPML